MFGLADNLVYQFPNFECESDNHFGVIVNGYLLYKNSYQEFDNLIYSIFTPHFIDSLGTEYSEKFISYNGKLAANAACRTSIAGTWRGVIDNFPDTFRIDYQNNDEICFYLISHYDHNWNSNGDFDIFTIEYPIRMIKTGAGWRIDEFHTTMYG